MKVLFVAFLLLVRNGLCRPLSLNLPKEESELKGIRLQTYRSVDPSRYTLVYEAIPGNIIRSVSYWGKRVYEPEGDDQAVERIVYLEHTRIYLMVAVESKRPQGTQMKYYNVNHQEVMRINFRQFLYWLKRGSNTLPGVM